MIKKRKSILMTGFLLLVSSCAQFGKIPEGEQMKKIEKSPQYSVSEKIFVNENHKGYKAYLKKFSFFEMLWKGLTNDKLTRPQSKLPEIKTDMEAFQKPFEHIKFAWYGHSTFIVRMNQKTILFDPVFSMHASPNKFVVPRFQKPIIDLADLPPIDYIVISHDHYDHLDIRSIEFFKNKNTHFFVPLGVSSHLIEWGVEPQKISEFDWWENQTLGDIEFICTPSQHFSGRSFSRNKTLWASWVLKTKKETIYFSGDSGYANHFKKIGEKYGPFDLAFLENGQYDDMWRFVHMHPEETAQAALDLKAKWMVPVHWGMFSLSRHHWYEPVVAMTEETKKRNVKSIVPIIGQLIEVTPKGHSETTPWWIPLLPKEKISSLQN
tara:strand:+ start:4129 stop:5265 length:1137 start_codon:yes stop_codon:yes gene_type:complete